MQISQQMKLLPVYKQIAFLVDIKQRDKQIHQIKSEFRPVNL